MRKKTFIGIIALSFVIAIATLSFAETDVTDKIQLNKSRMRYDRSAGTNYLDVSLTNISQDVLLTPIKVVIENISPTDVTVANADGTTADGQPFFDYSLDSGQFLPGNTTDEKNWIFSNPNRRRFSYDVTVLAIFSGEVKMIGSEGGIFEFPNGVILDVPPGALTETVAISVTDLPIDQVDAILSGQKYALHRKRCIGGFSAEPSLVFNVPIKAIVPVLPLEPGEIPLQMEIDFNEQKYWITKTNLTFLSDQGVAEIEIHHFSELAVGAIHGIDPIITNELCTDPIFNPILPICKEISSPGQAVCCLLLKEDRPVPGDPNFPCECCRESGFWVVSDASDWSSSRLSGDCEILADSVEITYHNCTLPDGSPVPTEVSQFSEISPNCEEDMTFEIDVHPATLNFFICEEEEQLTATITGKDADGEIVISPSIFRPKWESANQAVVEINHDGIVKGISEGTTTVLAVPVVEDPRITQGQALINVRSNIRSFSVTPSQVGLQVGDGRILEAIIVDAEGNLLDANSVTWSSSNTNIAYVTQDTGQWTSVEGRETGTVIITASYQYECETVLTTAEITVGCPEVDSINIDWDVLNLFINESWSLTATLFDSSGGEITPTLSCPVDITWSANQGGIIDVAPTTGASVDVTGLSPGAVTLTATTAGGKSDSVSITVEPCPKINNIIVTRLAVGTYEVNVDVETCGEDPNSIEVTFVGDRPPWLVGPTIPLQLLWDHGGLLFVGHPGDTVIVTVSLSPGGDSMDTTLAW